MATSQPNMPYIVSVLWEDDVDGDSSLGLHPVAAFVNWHDAKSYAREVFDYYRRWATNVYVSVMFNNSTVHEFTFKST